MLFKPLMRKAFVPPNTIVRFAKEDFAILRNNEIRMQNA